MSISRLVLTSHKHGISRIGLPTEKKALHCCELRTNEHLQTPLLASVPDMGESRGWILLGNTLAFGITTVCMVALRIGYRRSKRWLDASDWCIAIALVRLLWTGVVGYQKGFKVALR